MSVPTENLHVAIVSWDGMRAAATAIAGALTGVAGRVSVVYSNAADVDEAGPGDWVHVPQSEYFGHKFKVLLDRVQPDEAMLLIQADARCEDWPALVRRCLEVAGAHDRLGIWSPSITGTPFPNNAVATGFSPGADLAEVLQCDGIVLALMPPVLERLRRLDFSMNNLGWGIDWAAIVFARSMGLLVVRDLACRVEHPPSRGYDAKAAEQQMSAFLWQLAPDERAQFYAMNQRLGLRRAERRGDVHLLASHLQERAAAAAPNAVPLEPLRLALPAVCLNAGRLTVLAAEGQEVALSIGDRRLPLTPVAADAPVFRPLALAPRPGEGVSVQDVSGQDWSCPGQTTLGMSFAPGLPQARVPLHDPVALPRAWGELHLMLGAAVHRADADLLVEWHDADDPGLGEQHYIKLQDAFSGSRTLGDYQALRHRIPDIGNDRVLRLSLCYWFGQGTGDLPAVVFLTGPVLIPGDGHGNAPVTVPLMTLGAGAADPAARRLGADLGVVPGPVTLHAGGVDLALLSPPPGPVSLCPGEGGLRARSDLPRPATVVVNGRITRSLWIGPQDAVLALSERVLTTPGAVIDLRDPTGTLLLARHVVGDAGNG